MADRCRACPTELDHCHGTLIDHPMRALECTAGGCTRCEVIRHAFVIDCEVVGCRCAQPPALAV